MILSFLLLSSSFFLENVEGQENPIDLVDCYFNIEMISSTDFYANIQMTVSRVTAFGETYNRAEINSLASSTNTDDIEAVGVIKNNLHNTLRNQLISVFGEDCINPLSNKPTFKSSYFYEKYNINLTSDYFGINETINPNELTNGALDMGGWLNYTFNFKAAVGWNNTYSINLGDKYSLQSASKGNVIEQIVEWTVLNRLGESPEKEGLLTISKANPTSDLNEEEITFDFNLNSRGEHTMLTNNVNLKSIDISNYNFLPDFISNLPFIPSDGIRLFVKNGMVSWDDIYQKTIDPVQSDIEKLIEESVFNQTLNFQKYWDENTTENSKEPYDLNNMDKNPPARLVLTDNSIKLMINQISSRALFGLVDAGAIASVEPNSINFGSSLKDIEYDYNITLQMPENIVLNDDNEYTWNKNKNFSGEILSNDPQDYKENEINTIVEIEVESTDLNLLSLFTGQTELVFSLKLQEEENYKVTQMPSEFSLPDSIDIDYLCSDALRLCIEEGDFKQPNIDEFLSNEKTIFEERLKQIIGLDVKGNTDQTKFQESLQWDGDILEMDENDPVIVRSYSHESLPIKFGLSIAPPAFDIHNQKFTFKGAQNQQITYRMIFPSGLSISSEDAQDKSYINKTRDGRQYLEIIFSPEEAGESTDVSLTITPSLFFILGVFTPCIISMIITLILIIVVIIFRRKRRRGGKIYSPPPQESQGGYEQEDYYIPPPPGSK